MNFKTTIVLIVLLAAALVFVFVARDDEPAADGGGADAPRTGVEPVRLFTTAAADVKRLTITAADGKKLVVTRSGDAWKIESPIAWPADQWEVRNLLDPIVGLQSSGIIELSAENRAAVGLEKPRFTIEFVDADDKTQTIEIGNPSSLGNDLYVNVGKTPRLAAGGGEINDKLDDGLDKLAESLRDKKLVNVTVDAARQLSIAARDRRIVLHKDGDKWRIVEPQQIPADTAQVNDLLYTITGLRAEEFIADPSKATGARLDQPRATVVISYEAPATQPAGDGATTRPVEGTTILVGQFTDIDRKQAYVKVTPPDVVAKAHLVETSLEKLLNASPLALRDRQVLDITPAEVSLITLDIEKMATTQPTTREASRQQITISRRPQAVELGPSAPSTAPTTEPTTAPATTQAATQPIEPPSQWLVTADGSLVDANDSAVNSVISIADPLRAEKYVEAMPESIVARYTLVITTEGPGGTPVHKHRLVIVDPGNDKPAVGQYNDLLFELPRTVLTQLDANFKK
jgi:hypothetical protein